jgi:hypothetical protein
VRFVFGDGDVSMFFKALKLQFMRRRGPPRVSCQCTRSTQRKAQSDPPAGQGRQPIGAIGFHSRGYFPEHLRDQPSQTPSEFALLVFPGEWPQAKRGPAEAGPLGLAY